MDLFPSLDIILPSKIPCESVGSPLFEFLIKAFLKGLKKRFFRACEKVLEIENQKKLLTDLWGRLEGNISTFCDNQSTI